MRNRRACGTSKAATMKLSSKRSWAAMALVLVPLMVMSTKQAVHQLGGRQSSVRLSRKLQQKCQEMDVDKPFQLNVRDSQMSLAVSSTLPDSNIVQTRSSDGIQWRLELSPEASPVSPYYHIINIDTNLAINVFGNRVDNGAALIGYAASDIATNDIWCFAEIEGGFYTIEAGHSGQVMDVPALNTDGVPLVQWNNTGSVNQQFQLVTPSTTTPCAQLPEITDLQLIARHSGMAVSVESNLEGGAVVQRTISSGVPNDDSLWELQPTGNGEYHIISKSTGYAVNGFRARQSNGVPLTAYKSSETATHDNWCFHDVGGGFYTIEVGKSGETMDVPARSMVDGAPIVQWPDSAGFNKQFQLVRADGNMLTATPCAELPTMVDVQLVARHSGMALSPASNIEGAEIIQRALSHTAIDDDTIWQFEPAGNGRYHIVNKATGYAINVFRARNSNGAPLIAYPASETAINDQWCFHETGDNFYTIQAERGNQVMDVPRRSTIDGTTVVQWPNSGAVNQQFQLIGISPVFPRPGILTSPQQPLPTEPPTVAPSVSDLPSVSLAPSAAPSFSIAPSKSPAPTATLDWTLTEFTNQFVSRHEACFVMANGKGYLIGGRRLGRPKPVNIFDPVAQSWSQGNATLSFQIHHLQCVAVNHEIFLVSSWTGNYPFERNVDSILVYDTVADTWDDTRTALNTTRRRGSGAAVLYGNEVYLSHGNQGGHGAHSTSVAWLDKYNIATDTWTALPDASHPRDHTGGAIVNGNLLCVAAGRDSGVVNWYDAVVLPTECFNLQTEVWEVHPDIPQGRAGSAYGQTCDGKLMVAGGEGFNRAYANVDVYDGTAWKTISPLKDSRHGTGLAVGCGACEQIHIAGGAGNQAGIPELFSVESLYPKGHCI